MVGSDHRPSKFVGGSTEALELAEALQSILEGDCDVTLWTQGVFPPGGTTVHSLLAAAQRFDFAIFMFAADDHLFQRGEAHLIPRDNTIFEMGLFLGELGLDRTFVLASASPQVKLPSDLSGVTYLAYRSRADGNIKASLGAAAADLKRQVRLLGTRDRRPNPNTGRADVSPEVTPFSVRAWRYLADCTNSYPAATTTSDSGPSVTVWAENLVGMLADLYASRSSDAYAVWLRPSDAEPKRLVPEVQARLPSNHRHYGFAYGEGLAGTVWQRRQSAATSMMRQHPWWVYRSGCENMTYICAPVGTITTNEGVLSLGSDAGFAIGEEDELVVSAFAGVLRLALQKS